MKVVIIGGVAAGPKVAARLRRLEPEAEITVIEQGELISYGACGLPLYLGNLVRDLDELRQTPAGLIRNEAFFHKQKGIQVLTRTKALKIDRREKTILTENLQSGAQQEIPYDVLVLATGAEAAIPPIPGIDLGRIFTLHTPKDAQLLKQTLKANNLKQVTILGAGLIGLEIADALAGPRMKVTLCEAESQVLPKMLDRDMARLVERKMRDQGVDMRLGARILALEGDDERNVCRVISEQEILATEAVVIAAGVRPRVELAREAGLQLGATGAIQVDKQLRTSDPVIFAAGDCAEQIHGLTGRTVYIPLASTANKQGRVIADNIAGGSREFSAVIGTSVLQAFELNIGRTGLGEEEARMLGYKVITSVSSGFDATHYYPMHDKITLKLIADWESGKLLGGQVCGIGEGIKRLDVLAAALKFQATVTDLEDLDLGYAPPYATAVDVLIQAAYTLENKRQGLVQSITPESLLGRLETQEKEKICLIDVREPKEVKANPIPLENVLAIPLGELLSRCREIPEGADLITLCELGIRAYEGACILKRAGLKQVAYLEGGMTALGASLSEAHVGSSH